MEIEVQKKTTEITITLGGEHSHRLYLRIEQHADKQVVSMGRNVLGERVFSQGIDVRELPTLIQTRVEQLRQEKQT